MPSLLDQCLTDTRHISAVLNNSFKLGRRVHESECCVQEGKDVYVAAEGTEMPGAKVVAFDVETCAGVIHVIDKVLIASPEDDMMDDGMMMEDMMDNSDMMGNDTMMGNVRSNQIPRTSLQVHCLVLLSSLAPIVNVAPSSRHILAQQRGSKLSFEAEHPKISFVLLLGDPSARTNDDSHCS